MGNCCVRLKLTRNRISERRKRKKIVLLLVGLDNAGKTATAMGLVRERSDDTVPTVGFSSFTLSYKGYTVVIYDLGGGPQIRGIWQQYFVDVHGIIYVVDASDMGRIDESRLILEQLLTHKKLAGKPLLLLANKQDCEGALDELDVVERLNLEGVVNQQKCPTLVETCSAVSKGGTKKQIQQIDPGIHNGYRWLLGIIIKNFKTINYRVEADTHEAQLQLEQEKIDRKQRVEERRREREEVEGTKIIPLRDDSPVRVRSVPSPSVTTLTSISEETTNARIITVKSVDSEEQSSDAHLDRSKINQFSSSNDSGCTLQNGDGDGDLVSLIPVQSPDSAVQSLITISNPDKSGEESVPSSSVKDAVRENLEKEVSSSQKKINFMKRSNKTAPAPTGVVIGDSLLERPSKSIFPGRRLPPLTPPSNRSKLFEAKAAKPLRLMKSLSLSLSDDDSDEKDKKFADVIKGMKSLQDTAALTSSLSEIQAGNSSHMIKTAAEASSPKSIFDAFVVKSTHNLKDEISDGHSKGA